MLMMHGANMKIYTFSAVFRLAVIPTQPPSQWVLAILFSGVKLPGCESDNSPPSSAKVKNERAVPFLHLYASKASTCTALSLLQQHGINAGITHKIIE